MASGRVLCARGKIPCSQTVADHGSSAKRSWLLGTWCMPGNPWQEDPFRSNVRTSIWCTYECTSSLLLLVFTASQDEEGVDDVYGGAERSTD